MQTPQFVKTFILSLYQITSESCGKIFSSINVRSCYVRPMQMVRKMQFEVEANNIRECPKRLSFSLEMLQDLPSSSWELECTVKLCNHSKMVSEVLFFRQCKTLFAKSILHNHPLLVSFVILVLYKRNSSQEELSGQAIYLKPK